MSSPPFSRRVLAALLPAEIRTETLADLDRLWQERAKRKGVASANRWYRGQLLGAFAPSVRAHVRRLRPTIRRGGLDSVRRDMGHAVRQLRRHPGVSAVVVVTLGLGIGTATAVFSAVNGLLLKPLPYGESDKLVMITSRETGSSLDLHVSGPDVLEMEAEIDELVAFAGFAEATVGPLTRVDRPQHVVTVPVTWDLFDVLDVEMTLGRRFLPEEGGPVPEGAGPRPGAAVVSHDFWVRSLGADPDAVGRVTAYVRDGLARMRLLTFLVQGFAALALGLSAVGLLSYSVRLRRRELGLRMALGAGGGGVVVRVLLEGLRLTAAGLALGAVGATLLGQVLRSHLFGVRSADPVTLGATAAVVLTVSMAAALLPALRAARVDPALTLRSE